MPKRKATPKAKPVKQPRGRPVGSSQVAQLTRIVTTIERLEELYRMDLTARGVLRVEAEGEGEIRETSDEDVAALLDALRSVKPQLTGAYIGDEEDKWEDGSPVIPEPLPRDQESLFGSGWGINVGPEGPEEDWSGPDSYGSPGKPASGDVPGPDSGEKQEG